MLKVMRKLFGGVVNERNYAEFQKELGKKFVAKSDYNAKLADLKAAQAELLALQGAAAEGEALRGRVAALEGELAAVQAECADNLLAVRVDAAVERCLQAAGAKNVAAVRGLLDLSAPEFAGDELVGLREQVAALQKAEDTAFLFEEVRLGDAADWVGFVPAAAGDLLDTSFAGGFRLRLEQASAARNSLEAVKIKQAAAAQGVFLP